MLCGWECNRRSGVTLATLHRLSGISTYRLNGLGREMSTPPKLHSEYYGIFTFAFYYKVNDYERKYLQYGVSTENGTSSLNIKYCITVNNRNKSLGNKFLQVRTSVFCNDAAVFRPRRTWLQTRKQRD